MHATTKRHTCTSSYSTNSRTRRLRSRGEKLIKGQDAPPGVRGLQFYPSRDQSAATCLWEADSVEAIQQYVDSTLGDSSLNTCYEVDAEQAFAERPLGLPVSLTIAA